MAKRMVCKVADVPENTYYYGLFNPADSFAAFSMSKVATSISTCDPEWTRGAAT